MGLMLLSCALPATTTYADGVKRTPPAMFTLLVGAAGRDRKSTCIAMARDMLVEAAPDHVGKSAGSAEGWLENISDRPYQGTFEEEMAQPLSQSGAGGHLEPLKATWARAWDGGPLSRKTMQIDTEVASYRYSLAGGINGSWLQEHTSPSDFTGGLFPRFFIVVGRRDRILTIRPGGPEHLAARDQLVADLSFCIFRGPPGVFTLDPDAANMAGQWVYQLEKMALSCSDNEELSALYMRCHVLGMRLAVLFAANRILADTPEDTGLNDTLIDGNQVHHIIGEDLVLASQLIVLHIDSCRMLMSGMAFGPAMRKRQRVLNLIPVEMPGVTRGQICKRAGLLTRDAKGIIETLLDECSITKTSLGSGKVVYLRLDTEAAVLSLVGNGTEVPADYVPPVGATSPPDLRIVSGPEAQPALSTNTSWEPPENESQ